MRDALAIGAAARNRRAVITAEQARSVAERRAAERQRKAKARPTVRIYAAARFDRLSGDWLHSPASGDYAVRQDLWTLKLRAHQLMRDNPWAQKYLRLCSESIVGPAGMTIQARLTRNETDQYDDPANAAIERAWKRWCKPRYCTVDGRMSFADVEEIAVQQWKGVGEALVQLVPFDNPFGFALQVIDADQLDHELNVERGTQQNEIRMGVEVDRWQRPLFYHIWDRHPSEPARSRNRERIPADRIVHLFTPERAGQTRAVTPFRTVSDDLRHLGGLQLAVLTLQRAAACKMGFLTFDEDKADPLVAEEGSEEDVVMADGHDAVAINAEPLSIEQLPKGFDFKPWDPGQPSPEYDAFTRNVLQEIAAGLGVSYSSFTGDLSRANYGSQRGGMLAERDYWKRGQRGLIEQLHTRVVRDWLLWAGLRGALRIPGRDVVGDVDEITESIEWQPRGFEWIDPKVDLEAALLEVAAGLNSLTNLCASKGRDHETILRQRKREIELAKQLGVSIALASPKAQPNGETDGRNPNGSEGGSGNNGSGNGNGNGAGGRLAHLQLEAVHDHS